LTQGVILMLSGVDWMSTEKRAFCPPDDRMVGNSGGIHMAGSSAYGPCELEFGGGKPKQG